ncbi:succinate dehydrogenase, hydrophobic membrane anchor protein [Blastochloris sulfoviridis]|uniref:Succinate dehydrogenase hydrophobic membrane anchor subunit n=1 Tax=Blastochloris sulfoviridis TaxID=50712 RepID=A0A5M6I3J8_9HYPH|nr:succinate dehydrogenase, hydrophobic membrane anchor protein [Blastochloris sulfoviridis]KAA5602437.1 succinate dehydrogenase, hydrophobic membrane anchor protein [Blastochloris sulfoviridis]
MSGSNSSIRTPMARARGFGSAKRGTEHFWAERVTGVALIPLTFVLVGVLVFLAGKDHASVLQWLANPLLAIPLVLAIATGTHHMKIGMQVIIEDYVHSEPIKFGALMANTFFSYALGATGAFAVLKIAFGG